jgi:hypothetical protein
VAAGRVRGLADARTNTFAGPPFAKPTFAALPGIDCSPFLNAWNFFDNRARLSVRSARSVDGGNTPYTRLARRAAASHDKLFWGCKLPAVTPPGQWFEPDWRAEELAEMSLILSAGLDQLESELQK